MLSDRDYEILSTGDDHCWIVYNHHPDDFDVRERGRTLPVMPAAYALHVLEWDRSAEGRRYYGLLRHLGRETQTWARAKSHARHLVARERGRLAALAEGWPQGSVADEMRREVERMGTVLGPFPSAAPEPCAIL